MAFTADQQRQVTDVLRAKLKQPCGSCGQYQRTLTQEIFLLAVYQPVKSPRKQLEDMIRGDLVYCN